MLDPKKLTGLQLKSIGEMVLNEINIKLFNFAPTIHKAYQIYNELIQHGYSETNKELACTKIKFFFKNRSIRSQHKEFYKVFGIPFSDEMRHFMAISFRTCEIPADKVDEIAFHIHRILSRLDDFNKHEIDKGVLVETLIELYQPKYFENEWRITMPRFSEKLKKILIQRGKEDCFMQVEDALYLIDPDAEKKKRPKLQLLKEKADCKLTDSRCLSEKVFKKNSREYDLFTVVGPNGQCEMTKLTSANVIKDSELAFVQRILNHINGDVVPENLDEHLYQNDERHPLVFNFLNLVKRYNRILDDKEMSLKEAFSEIKMVVRAIRETGEDIIKTHEEVIGEKGERLNWDLKKSG